MYISDIKRNIRTSQAPRAIGPPAAAFHGASHPHALRDKQGVCPVHGAENIFARKMRARKQAPQNN